MSSHKIAQHNVGTGDKFVAYQELAFNLFNSYNL